MSKIIDKTKKLFYKSKKSFESTLNEAKIRHPKLFDSRYNKTFVFVSFIVLLSLITTVSYATFVYLTNDYKAADIRFANLMYSLKIDKVATKTATINANSTKTIEIDVESLNEIGSKYLVFYTSTADLTNVKVQHSNLTTANGSGKIKTNDTRTIRIVVTNNSASNVTLNFDIKGGYVYNNLDVSEGQHKIEGTFDEKSNSSGDIVLRSYLAGRLIEQLPNHTEMTSNNYVFDDVASTCTNNATINYVTSSSNNELEIGNIGAPTECIAVFHKKERQSLSVLANNLLVSEIPEQTSGYVFEEGKCNNGATITWNNETWSHTISNVTQDNTNCVLKFKK